MNFDLFDELSELLQENKLDKAIKLAEIKLNELQTTEFHKVLNKDLLHLKPKLATYLENFYNSASNYFKKKPEPKKLSFFENLIGKKEKEIVFDPNRKLKAIYCEMNGFSINYELWFINMVAFDFYKGIDNDLNWLCDFGFNSENSLTISGLEDIQIAFKNYMENLEKNDENEKKSKDLCEFIIILKLQELFKNTYIENKDKQWTDIPMLVTAHDYDLIYKVEK